MAVSKRLRYEILRRDAYACRYCGGTAPDVVLTIDHVIPSTLGGDDDPSNLVAACKDCNAGKSASSPDAPLVADVAADALRWGAAMQYAAEVQLKRREDEKYFLARFDVEWDWWRANGGEGDPMPRPGDWETSVLRFRASGLTGELLEDAIEIAMKAPKVAPSGIWRYFCGVCWRRLDEMQEIARAHLTTEGDAPDTAETPTTVSAQDESQDAMDWGLTDDPLAAFLRQSAAEGGPKVIRRRGVRQRPAGTADAA